MAAFRGFDCGSYPGDEAVRKWAGGGSPFQFLGFYLDAPCHTRKSYTPFAGKYQLLKSLGWGLAIVYVGRQVKGCGSRSLTRATGEADGRDAIAKCQAEGFPPAAIIYLDVEPFDGALPSKMGGYVGAWLDTLLHDGKFQPGIYCHAKNAIDLHTVGEERFSGAGNPAGAPSFWITRERRAFDLERSVPADSGISFADAWQGQLEVAGVAHAGATIAHIDLNVARMANPSRA